MIGKTLGHYKVGEQLGLGGMGEVYVADDLNLNRKVAVKFLPDAFAKDPERMARFEREAKVLASLNHPNIAAIYGLEHAEGKRFIVMELAEGETLAQQLNKGALPIEDALGICRQIADGLEAAHERGVIHRDLKPANVMIAEGDKVKILDFGLAKALSDETQSVDSSQSPTLTEAMTRPGVILGTAAYMSPEQAKGKAVDRRADIWAFGCILYECLTDKRVFDGETVTETLAAVLTREPEWEKVPAQVRPLLRRCLEKDPKKRLRDIGDAYALIEAAPESVREKRPRLAWIWAAITTVLMLALAMPTYLYFRGREEAKDVRFHVSGLRMPDEYSMAISPDGRVVAFVASTSATAEPSLFVREMASITHRKLEGTEGAAYPFWSPDSQSIAFFAGGRLRRIDLSGGPPRDICTVNNLRGGTWNREDVIVFGDWPLLHRVSAAGGEPATITKLDESQKEINHVYPYFLPDGRHYLYETRFTTPSHNGVYVGSLDSPGKTRLLTGETMAVYAEPGYLLFQRDGSLYAQPFDAKKLVLSGKGIPITDNVVFNYGGWSGFGASQNGTLIYRSGEGLLKSQFLWFDRTGRQLGPAGKPGIYIWDFDLSPDGKQIALKWRDPASSSHDIWLMDWARNFTTRLTANPAVEEFPVWSPDGLRVAFTSHRNGTAGIFEKKASGVGEETVLLDSPDNEWPKAWSQDGRYLAYARQTGSNWDIHILPMSGDRKPFPIAQGPGIQEAPNFSFNGKWLAYDSEESGKFQVYVISFPAADRIRQISNNGGVEPRWRQDGKELYYLALDGKMMAAGISAGSEITSEVPRVLFDTGFGVKPAGSGSRLYAVTPDGERFLLLKPVAEAATTPITVVLNWTSLLKK